MGLFILAWGLDNEIDRNTVPSLMIHTRSGGQRQLVVSLFVLVAPRAYFNQFNIQLHVSIRGIV